MITRTHIIVVNKKTSNGNEINVVKFVPSKKTISKYREKRKEK